MFEFLTSQHAISIFRLYAYYTVLIVLYLLFLRKIKLNILTILIMLLFNQGFIILFDHSNRLSKLMFSLISVHLVLKMREYTYSKNDLIILYLFTLYSILYLIRSEIYNISIVNGVLQYYKYITPVALFFGLKSTLKTHFETIYGSELVIKLLKFQVVFSIVKIVVIGFRENITGSIANTGGGIGVCYSTLGAILIWVNSNKTLKAKEWWVMLALLVLPIAQNKRAIWIIYPTIISLMLLYRIDKQTLRKLSYIILFIPVIIYIGFRLNPSFNPEGILWGSFNPTYAVEFTLEYSGVSQKQIQSNYTTGRWGASINILKNTLLYPMKSTSFFGFGNLTQGDETNESFNSKDFGLGEGSMISSIGLMTLQFGWPITLILLLLFVQIIYTIPDKKIARIISFYLFIDFVFYSGSIINSPFQSMLLVLVVSLIGNLSKQYSMNKTSYHL